MSDVGGPDGPAGRKLRVSYLLPQFPVPTQTFAQSDIAALEEAGHKVVVHTVKPGREDNSARKVERPSLRGALRWPGLCWRMRSAGAQVAATVLANAARAPLIAASALASLPRAMEIADAIERGRSDVVHLFWARHAALVLALLKARGSPALRSAFVGAYDLVADDFLVELTFASAEVVFSHAEVNRPFLERKAHENCATHIVHRGIPLPGPAPESERDPDLWITVSALVAAKNVKGVLHAFARARDLRPALKLQVFGDGPNRAALENLAGQLGCSDAVHFAGHVDRQEIFAAMSRAGVFLLFSKKASERLPNVVKEALWAGCMVMASDTPGIAELLPQRGIGIIVDPDDEAAVASAVQEVLQMDNAGLMERRERIRAHISEHFSADASMKRYAEIWRALLADRLARR
ncbi:MAG: glycosyltransferase [Alteripontixanthobacter sp.]